MSALFFATVPAAAAAESDPPAPATVTVDMDGIAADDDADSTAATVSEPVRTPVPFSMIGFELPDDADVSFRTSVDGDEWTAWTPVEPLDVDDRPDPGTVEEAAEADSVEDMSEPVWVGEAEWLQTRVAGGDTTEAVPHLIDSMGLSRSLAQRTVDAFRSALGGSRSTAQASPGRPDVVSRAGWGANESWAGTPSYASAGVRYGVVHHTAHTPDRSRVNSYSRAEAPGLVRGMYAYHTRTLGWRDIGYNALVDRFGTVYEGRAGGLDRAVVGAHAAGFNTGSFGISVIGEFTGSPPSEAARDSVVAMLAWRFALAGVDPTGQVTVRGNGGRYPGGQNVRIPTIIGHRDVGYTACPGDRFYAQLDGLRSAVDRRMSAASPSPSAPPAPPVAAQLERLSDSNAVGTAVAVSRAAFDEDGSATRAVVAGDRVFADATAGGPLAGADGPLLLTRPDRLDRVVLDELRRVLPAGSTVYLLGGESAVGPAVEDALSERWNVRRLAGADRAETAALVAERVFALRSRWRATDERVALVARAGPDTAWADALAAGAYGARHGTPVLLTASDRLSPVTARAIEDLGVNRTAVIGGPAAVSEAVVQALPQPWRYAGDDRAGTAAVIARWLWSRRAANPDDAWVFAGGYRPSAWKDALVAAPLSARRDAPVLLLDTDRVPTATRAHLTELGYGSGVAGVAFVVGGPAAVRDPVAQEVRALLE